MTIQRFETGPRMSQAVVHGNTVYLAGVVANTTKGESVTKQTQEILSIIDGHLAKAGTDKSKLLTATIYITDMKTFPEMKAARSDWPRRPRPARESRACPSRREGCDCPASPGQTPDRARTPRAWRPAPRRPPDKLENRLP